MRMPAQVVARLSTFYQDRTVCVTGGAGFIGGHLIDTLLTVGATVQVIDDLSNADLAHLGPLIDMEPDRVCFVHGSILEDQALADAAGNAKTIFHLAAIGSVPRSIDEPERTWEVNATGTLRVLQAARAADAQRVLLKTLVLDNVQDGQADRARYRIAAEGVEVLHSVGEALGDLGRGDDGAQWMPVPHGLAHGHDVGYDALSLEAPEVASHAAEAHLDL
ncbi:MAG: GDP-mannose 4,6-dehydratase, partial [Planctomycetes bacterium]|nr:GDP-mannose 4,6-dehydratase [Planctomycetota bacterium]